MNWVPIRGALLIPLLIAACTPAAPASPAPVPSGPQYADQQTLVLGFPNAPGTLDPHLLRSGGFRRFEMYETLTLLSDGGRNLEPLLATEWKTTDPTTWRLTLRKDSKFHDGSALTAADVAFSWQRVQRPELKSPVPGGMASIADITAVDPQTVEIKTKAPDPILLRRLSQLSVLPKAYLERVGDAEFAAKPIGSGPFKLKDFKPDDRVVVTRWDEHPYRKPKLTEITIRAVPDAATRLTGLRTGELDMAMLLSVEAADTLKREGFQTLVASQGIAGALFDAWGTDGSNGAISDKRVRQALNYAVDRETMAKTIYRGFAKPVGLHIKEGAFGFNPDIKPYTYDPKKAKELLAAAGYTNGLQLQMDIWPGQSAENQPNGLFVQSQFKEIGVDLELVILDSTAFVDRIYKRKPQSPLLLGGLSTDPLADADAALTWFWSSQPTFGKRLNNPEFDAAYVASRSEMDPKKREDLLKKAAAALQDDPGFLSLVDSIQITAFSKTVIGFSEPVDGWPVMDRIARIK